MFREPITLLVVKQRCVMQGRYEFLIPKHTSLSHRLAGADEGLVDFVEHLLTVDPSKRPSAEAALQHPWLQVQYEYDT